MFKGRKDDFLFVCFVFSDSFSTFSRDSLGNSPAHLPFKEYDNFTLHSVVVIFGLAPIWFEIILLFFVIWVSNKMLSSETHYYLVQCPLLFLKGKW